MILGNLHLFPKMLTPSLHFPLSPLVSAQNLALNCVRLNFASNGKMYGENKTNKSR